MSYERTKIQSHFRVTARETRPRQRRRPSLRRFTLHLVNANLAAVSMNYERWILIRFNNNVFNSLINMMIEAGPCE